MINNEHIEALEKRLSELEIKVRDQSAEIKVLKEGRRLQGEEIYVLRTKINSFSPDEILKDLANTLKSMQQDME